MCVCWVSVDCEEPEVKEEEPPVTEAPQDYKEEEVNYQNAVSQCMRSTSNHGTLYLYYLS